MKQIKNNSQTNKQNNFIYAHWLNVTILKWINMFQNE